MRFNGLEQTLLAIIVALAALCTARAVQMDFIGLDALTVAVDLAG
jgi:hypothetical protein